MARAKPAFEKRFLISVFSPLSLCFTICQTTFFFFTATLPKIRDRRLKQDGDTFPPAWACFYFIFPVVLELRVRTDAPLEKKAQIEDMVTGVRPG